MKFNLNFFCALFLLMLLFNPVVARAEPTVWEVLRNQFQLNHEINQPEVQQQLRWLVTHPNYLQKLARCEPYMYHIVNQVKKRNLPGELALLPMLESAYDPFAYSVVGAAGLWQLMPGTGNTLGLRQDWWYDGRRSVGPATDAALTYLNYLNRYFNGNWILAIAAYDAGEGTISRAIKTLGLPANRISFWLLSVPNETRAYVPRLLALAEIVQYPERYRIKLPKVLHVPYFEEINIGSQIDLNHAAELAGISYKDLIKLNPGYNRWATAPYQPYKLLIPRTKVELFTRNLAHTPPSQRISWTKHRVKQGDNLHSIANRYFTTPTLIAELNQLSSNNLKIGQELVIPNTKNTPTLSFRRPLAAAIDKPISIETYKVIHIVQKGEDLESIEKRYQVNAIDIMIWNKLNSKDLSTGQQLTLWRRHINPGLYTVKIGDSLNGIAKANNTSLANLQRLNPGIASTLKPGQKIIIG